MSHPGHRKESLQQICVLLHFSFQLDLLCFDGELEQLRSIRKQLLRTTINVLRLESYSMKGSESLNRMFRFEVAPASLPLSLPGGSALHARRG